ncbi:MAG: FHA domain-containing protein [Paludibacteraceae bacterium]|nr:FHA domain-containing protein [Bacteroidales bacterium]MDY4149105.1 FHA domain-containing protein [Paludibacteraceae bacterium]
MNTITIGRNPQNTIVVGAEYTTVSGQHATIEQVGNQLYLQDHSTNGTYINGRYIHNERIEIKPTDSISLGSQYFLNMQQINAVIGNNGVHRNTQRVQNQDSAKQAVVININNVQAQCAASVQRTPPSQPAPQLVQKSEPSNLNSFNFGAFYFNWIWGLANGVYWALLCLIPYIGLIVAIVLGVKANRTAWEKFNGTAQEFEDKQAAWTKWAWILLVCCFFIGVILGIALSV